jgi:hypothetical protein
MTQTPLPSDRLDRIEAILLHVAQQQQTNTAAIERNATTVTDLQQITQQNAAAITDLQQITQQNAAAITDLQQLTQQNAAAIADLSQNFEASVAELVSWIGEFAEEGQRDREVIREIQNEVRGIQTENQRILQYLFGQQGGEG